MNFLKKLEPFTLLLLRCGLALVFIYHGYPKLFGERERIIESFQAIGLPALVVYLTGSIEFFCGLALAMGLLTPFRGSFFCSRWSPPSGNTNSITACMPVGNMNTHQP